MCYKLILLCLVIFARGDDGIWNSLSGNFTNLVDDISYVYMPSSQEDAYLNIIELAEKYRYPIETHTVITQDGYILDMHRLPKKNATNKVVFLMHGLWESSDSWLLQGPKKSLGYILADEGYDVWMGNARGNRHSSHHEKLTSKMSKFWEFSWEEIGLYDVPAMIDHVLNITGENSIYYVGFSQGTTSYFVMNTMRPEYNKKIKLMFALAPEVFLGNAKHEILKMFSPASSFLPYFIFNFNIYSPSTDFINIITPVFCNMMPGQCGDIFSIVGPYSVKKSLIPVILGHVPTGTSTLQFIHFGQLSNSNRFCRFDFGFFMNLIKYGSFTPPDYDLKAVKSPVIIFQGEHDWFSDPIDGEHLKNVLPNVVGVYYIKPFGHVDFMYADEAASLVYSNIVRQLKKHRVINL